MITASTCCAKVASTKSCSKLSLALRQMNIQTKDFSVWQWNHIKYMPPRSFMFVPEWFIFHVPTPAVWPKGWTLSSVGGPCLSGASWSALLRLASIRSQEARRGVNGFGSFCRNKRASPAGAKTGNTEHHLDTRFGDIDAIISSLNTFLLKIPGWIPDTHQIQQITSISCANLASTRNSLTSSPALRR